jgi:tetraacyldisaccharide 4'-kinase
LSGAWWVGSTAHRALYQSGLKQRLSVDTTRVVAVGNVVAGGAGKTPVTLALMELCVALRVPAAVVGRGYGADVPPDGVFVDGKTAAATAGDEPVLLARAVPQVKVYAGRDRALLADRAAREGARVVFLDDAMQHHRVKADALVAVVRSPQPFGNGRLMPAGPLRESPQALRRADVVVILGPDDDGDSQRQVRAAGVEEGHILHGVLEPGRLRNVDGTPGPELDHLRGLRVVAAAGMARPQALGRSLADLGAEVMEVLAWEDHAPITVSRVEMALTACARHGAQALVVTEKDAVKWPSPTSPLPVLVLPVRVAWKTSGATEVLAGLLGAATPGG